MRIFLKSIFILLSTLNITLVNADCLKDIFAVGLSADSVSYKAERDSKKFAKLATTSGLGLKASWFIFCPDKSWEYNAYLRLRSLSFSDKNNLTEFRGVSESQHLPSIGLEGRKFIKLWGKYMEVLFDVELRSELGMVADDNLSYLTSETYTNLKAMAGFRYYLKKWLKRDVTAVAKLGPLIPISSASDSSLGVLYGISAEYLQKMGKKASLRADFYYDVYSQDYGSLQIKRNELGLRLNLIFRL